MVDFRFDYLLFVHSFKLVKNASKDCLKLEIALLNCNCDDEPLNGFWKPYAYGVYLREIAGWDRSRRWFRYIMVLEHSATWRKSALHSQRLCKSKNKTEVQTMCCRNFRKWKKRNEKWWTESNVCVRVLGCVHAWTQDAVDSTNVAHCIQLVKKRTKKKLVIIFGYKRDTRIMVPVSWRISELIKPHVFRLILVERCRLLKQQLAVFFLAGCNIYM